MQRFTAGRFCAHARRLRTLTLALFSIGFSATAWAEEPDVYNNFRVGMFAGEFAPNLASWQGNGVVTGLPPFAASGHLSLNTGSALAGFVGYTFDDFLGIDWLRQKVNLEMQLGLVNATFNRLDGTLSLAGLGSSTGSFPLTGHVSTLVGGLNALVCPFGQREIMLGDHAVTPYIGTGIGFARSNVTLQSFNLGGSILPVNARSSETDPALNFTVGVDITPLPETLPKLEIGIAYQYSRIFSNHLGTGAGIAANSGDVSGHIFGLLFEYRVTERPTR